MSDADAGALLAIAYGFLQDRLAAGDRDTRNQLLQLLEVEDRKAVRLTLDGVKVKVGAVTHAKGSVSVRVDDVALLQWAKANRPDDVETVTVETERLKPWLRDELVSLAKKDEAVDSNGEPIPGLELVVGASKIVVNRDKSPEAQAALIGELFANGGLGMRRVLALEPPEEES